MSRRLEKVKFADTEIYVEVSEIEADVPTSSDGFEDVSADKFSDAAPMIEGVLKGISHTVRQALQASEPSEWAVEVAFGFKGKAGIPFITEGEANGAVKVTVKWKG